MPERLRLADLLGGLSIASDLGFGLPPEEAMRGCLVSTALARKLDLGEEEVREAYYVPLLLHVGCTAVAHETSALFGDERVLTAAVARTNFTDPRETLTKLIPAITKGMHPVAKARLAARLALRGDGFARVHDVGSCEVAQATARRVGLGGGVERAVSHVFEWWRGGWVPRGLAGEEIARPARIARVASDAALFDDLGDARLAVDAVRRRAGSVLDPEIVEVFAANADELLAEANTGDPRERILEVEPEPVVECDRSDLARVAAAFGDVADLKTPFTHGHSREVASIAAAAARRLRLDSVTVARLEVAALLHDLGRVAISNVIWDKEGPLTAAEWEQVRMHAYHSERILATSAALAPVAPLAGMHHERLDGSGYHRACRARELPAAARLLAAADAFQAMTQQRPHRAALTRERAAAELSAEARRGRLDPDCVGAVLEVAGAARRRARRDLRPAGLTEREIEVVRLVAAGLSNPEIARRLVISRRTAEHHVQHVYAKLRVSSRAAVALFAHEHDLISSGEDG